MKASPNRLSNLLIRLSGQSPAIASKLCETEQIRLAAMGLTLLVPVTIAGTGAFGTVYQMSAGNFTVSVWVAAIIAVFTFLIDRALLASPMERKGIILQRILLTVVTSTVFAHTALLWLFSEKIDEEARAAKLSESRVIAREVQTLKQSFEESESEESKGMIDQLGLLNEELRQVSRKIADRDKELVRYRAQYEAEIAGRGISSQPGEGPQSRRIQRDQIDPLVKELTMLHEKHRELLKMITALQNQLSESRRNKENDSARIVRKEESDRLVTESLERSYRGILTRFILLHEIIRKDRSALAAYLLICILLLLWELLPLTLKLNARDSEYARAEALEKERAEVLRQAEQHCMGESSALEKRHELRLKLMQLEAAEIEEWTRQTETRFETVQKKRAAIPKRATPEQREAYLKALEVLMTSLQKVGDQLSKS